MTTLTLTGFYLSQDTILAPNSAQENSTGVISCDVPYGATFNEGQVSAINWSITGYEGFRYVLIHNNEADDFGQITSNTSYLIHQKLGEQTSWQYCGIQVYDGNTLLDEEYVAFEIKEAFWSFNAIFLLASGSVVSIAVVTDVLMWRKFKRANTGREESLPRTTQRTPTYPTNSGILLTQTPQDEVEYTTISTMRVMQIWLWNSEARDYFHKWLVREDISDPNRMGKVDGELGQALGRLAAGSMHRTHFLNVVSMLDSERLLAAPVTPHLILLVLFSGRITQTYLKLLQGALYELGRIFGEKIPGNVSQVYDILDTHLLLSQSRIYVEGPSETTLVLQNCPFPEIMQDPEIYPDARGLTPAECETVTTTMKALSTRQATDLIIDEVEDLSHALSSNKN